MLPRSDMVTVLGAICKIGLWDVWGFEEGEVGGGEHKRVFQWLANGFFRSSTRTKGSSLTQSQHNRSRDAMCFSTSAL